MSQLINKEKKAMRNMFCALTTAKSRALLCWSFVFGPCFVVQYSKTCVKRPPSKRPKIGFHFVTSFVDLLCFCSVLCLLCLCARLFICALWSPAGKGLTSWLSFVVSNCEFVTFPSVSLVRCGT